MTKEGGVLVVAACALGVIGLLDLDDIMPLRPCPSYARSPLLLGPLSAHFTSATFTMLGYLHQHPIFPALSMYLRTTNHNPTGRPGHQTYILAFQKEIYIYIYAWVRSTTSIFKNGCMNCAVRVHILVIGDIIQISVMWTVMSVYKHEKCHVNRLLRDNLRFND
jgi:hypothetical protein